MKCTTAAACGARKLALWAMCCSMLCHGSDNNSSLSENWRVGVFAGTGERGSSDGSASDVAQFKYPSGLTFVEVPKGLGQDFVLVSDTNSHLLRRSFIFQPGFVAGPVHTIAGIGRKGHADHEEGLRASFNQPEGLDVDPSRQFVLVAGR